MSIAMVMDGPGEAPRAESRPVPDPSRGEAVVAVRASSMNYHDLVNLMGFIRGPWPRVPMTDGCGEVVAVAPDVQGVAVGDRVVGAFHPLWLDGGLTRASLRATPGDTGDGWLQQHMAYPANALVPAPGHLSNGEAATLVCAGVTAWSALRAADVKPGDVVVTQGTGGVSLYAVQLAAASGATVIVTSSSDEKLETARSLGAHHLINYRTTPEWHKTVVGLTSGRGADMVIDLGGAETLAKSIGRDPHRRHGRGHRSALGLRRGPDPGDVGDDQADTSPRHQRWQRGRTARLGRGRHRRRNPAACQPHLRLDRTGRGPTRPASGRAHRQDRRHDSRGRCLRPNRARVISIAARDRLERRLCACSDAGIRRQDSGTDGR